MAELVIFDCDGILVDTEQITNRILAELVTEVGLPMTTADSMARYMGRSMTAVVSLIEAELGRTLPATFVDAYDERCFAAFDAEVAPMPGAFEAIDAVELLGIHTCVASSGSHAKMRRTLGATGLLERFDGRIFSASEVAQGKPAPDLFLHAAAHMGTHPQACVVVEDSPAGVLAAVSGGMRAIGLPGPVGAAALTAAGAEIIESLDRLVAAIGEPRRGHFRGR